MVNAGEEIDALLSRIALGDRRAFQQLYRRTSPKLFGVALRILRDRALAEEAVQEAYVKIWRGAAGYRSERGSSIGWLISLQRNQAIDILRARQKLNGEHAEIRDIADHAPGPQESAEAADERRRLERCLAELPAERAGAVRGAYVEGWTYVELARHHGVPLNTMRTWLRRSLLRLKKCLAP